MRSGRFSKPWYLDRSNFDNISICRFPFFLDSRPLRMFLHKLTRLFQDWRTYLQLDLHYFMTGGSQRIESSPATPPGRNLDFVRTDDGDDSWPMGQSAAVVSTAFDLMRGRNTEKNAPKRVRVREFFSQTDAIEQQEKMVQTDPKMQGSEKKKEKPQPRGSKLKVQKTELKAKEGSAKLASSRTRGFNDPDQLKQKARQALIKPPYNVFDYYHEEGVFQRVAKSTVFDYLSLTVVCLNAMWIAVDADLNGAALITDAPPVFIVVENLFCTYFVSEVFIRFMAFEEKSRCLRDRWFVFDSLLASWHTCSTTRSSLQLQKGLPPCAFSALYFVVEMTLKWHEMTARADKSDGWIDLKVFFMVLETWIAPIIVVSFNIDLDNALDLSTLSASSAIFVHCTKVRKWRSLTMQDQNSLNWKSFLPIGPITLERNLSFMSF